MKNKANNFCFRIQGYVGGCFSLQTTNVKNNEMLLRIYHNYHFRSVFVGSWLLGPNCFLSLPWNHPERPSLKRCFEYGIDIENLRWILLDYQSGSQSQWQESLQRESCMEQEEIAKGRYSQTVKSGSHNHRNGYLFQESEDARRIALWEQQERVGSASIFTFKFLALRQ